MSRKNSNTSDSQDKKFKKSLQELMRKWEKESLKRITIVPQSSRQVIHGKGSINSVDSSEAAERAKKPSDCSIA